MKYTQKCPHGTTGIWQTVWLECFPNEYISTFKLIPDPVNNCVHIGVCLEGITQGDTQDYTIESISQYNGKDVGSKKAIIEGKTTWLTLDLSEVHLWQPGKPELYDLQLELYKS